jgi:hypothetical protein
MVADRSKLFQCVSEFFFSRLRPFHLRLLWPFLHLKYQFGKDAHSGGFHKNFVATVVLESSDIQSAYLGTIKMGCQRLMQF